jgi:endonuclease III
MASQHNYFPIQKSATCGIKVDVHHWLIMHGHYTCVARKPKCGACMIEDLGEFKDKPLLYYVET